MVKQENMQFRIMYFIAIIMIVDNHGGHSISLLYEWLPAYSFHVALFIFCSGYFFIKNEGENVLKTIKKVVKKLLIPLYVWNLIYGVIVTILHMLGIKFGSPLSLNSLLLLPMYNGHQFALNFPTWFIFPLFVVQLLNALILNILKNNNNNYYVHFVIALILGFIGVQLSIDGYNTGWNLLLVRVLYFLPFFSLGMLYNKNLEKKDKSNNLTYFTIIFAIALIIIYIFGGPISYIPSWMTKFDNFWRPFVVAFLGIAFWLRVSKILVPSLKDSKLVKIVSKNTFSIMTHHMFGFFIVNTGFYLLSLKLKFIEGFNYSEYISNVFYAYTPKHLMHFKLIYLVVGIAFSLGVALSVNKIKNRLLKRSD